MEERAYQWAYNVSRGTRPTSKPIVSRGAFRSRCPTQDYRNESNDVEEFGQHALRKRTLKSSRKKKEKASKADPNCMYSSWSTGVREYLQLVPTCSVPRRPRSIPLLPMSTTYSPNPSPEPDQTLGPSCRIRGTVSPSPERSLHQSNPSHFRRYAGTYGHSTSLSFQNLPHQNHISSDKT